MNTRQRSLLVNLNRVLIFALTAGRLPTDALQLADLFGIVALFVWLWLPQCTRLEARLLRWAGGKRSSLPSSPISPSV